MFHLELVPGGENKVVNYHLSLDVLRSAATFFQLLYYLPLLLFFPFIGLQILEKSESQLQ